MLRAAFLAFDQIFTPPFRRVLWRSVGLTLSALAAVWVAAQVGLSMALTLPYPWVETLLAFASGFGLLFILAFLVAPVTALVAGLFLDEVAEAVEKTYYSGDPPGRALPLARSLLTTLRFTGVVIVVNLVALPLVFVLGFGVVVFLVANGYLLGREYFEFAALRFHDRRTVEALRARYGGTLFLAGLLIAGFVAVPVLNLAAPLFAAAFMVHLQKRIAAREERSGGLLSAV